MVGFIELASADDVDVDPAAAAAAATDDDDDDKDDNAAADDKGDDADGDGGGNLLSGDEVAVEVELALKPLSASRLVTECGRRATTV